MAIEVLLDLIRTSFAPADRKIVAESIQQDPLIWEFAQDTGASLLIFKSADGTRDGFAPAAVINALIEEKFGLDLTALSEPETVIPEELTAEAAKVFESTLNTGLSPTDVLSAGLLTFALLKEYRANNSWQGIANKILVKQGTRGIEKNIQIWQTPAACLYVLNPDFDGFITDFMQENNSAAAKTGLGLFIHALLSNPIPQTEKLDHLYVHVSSAGIDLQLEALEDLQKAEKKQMAQLLASSLLQTRSTADFMARTFSELEAFQTPSDRIDPLEKSIRMDLAEDLSKVAALLHYAGNEIKSSESYASASCILSFIQTQAQYQAIAGKSGPEAKAAWQKIIEAEPNSQLARLQYSHFLVEQCDFEEAKQQLSQIPDSPQKSYLTAQINQTLAKGMDQQVTLKLSASARKSPSPNFFVHDLALDCDDEILRSALVNEDLKIANAKWPLRFSNLKQVRLMRDWFSKSELYEKAIELTSYLELVEPEAHDHRKVLARLYGKAQQWSKAFAAIQEIVKSEVNPVTSDLLLFAESALHTKQTDLAISICQNVLKDHPTQPKALILLGEGFWQKGDTVKAIQHMEEVVETIPEEAATWLALAQIWQENDQTDKTMEVLQKGVVAIPDSPELLRELGKLMLEKQSPADAISYLKRAHDIDGHNPEGQFYLARASYKLGRYEEAWALLQPHIADYEQKPAVAKLLGHVLLAMQQAAEAKPILLFASEKYPNDRDIVLSAAKVVIAEAEAASPEVNQAELSQLRSILSAYLAANGPDTQVKLNLADVERLSGDSQLAFETYLDVSKQIHPAKSRATWQLQYGLGKTALAMGKIEMAVATLQEAAGQQPENTTILHALAKAYQASELDGKASDTAILALKLAPQDLDNILWYARFRMDAGKPEEAVKTLKEALILQPNQPALKLWLSRAHLSLGEMDTAESNLISVINSADVSPEQLQDAAYQSIRLNNFDLAIKALEKAIQNASDFSPLMVMDLATAYTSQNQRREALEALDLDVETFIQYPELALLKADILDYLGQYQPALTSLQLIESIAEDELDNNADRLKAYSKSPLLYPVDFSMAGYQYRLGQLYRALGNNEDALSHLEAALERNPSNLKIRLACAETHSLNMAFRPALDLLSELNVEQKDQDSLDIACMKSELTAFLTSPNPSFDQAQQFTSGLVTYPRLLAIQSRIAASMGELEVARTYLDEAYKAFFQNNNATPSVNVANISRRQMTLIGMAEAALDLKDMALAVKLYQHAAAILPDQSLVNWRYANSLALAAEEQRKAELLSITDHAPGGEFVSGANQAQFNILIEKVKNILDQNDWVCLKARGASAFEGDWQLMVNYETCLSGPNAAAAMVMSCDDDEIVRQALETYPNAPQVLQAYGLNALKFHKVDAIPMVEKALEFDTLNASNHALLAYLYQDNPEMALKSIDTALQIWPTEPAWYAYAAELEMQAGNTNDASAHISQALDADPDNADFWLQSAEIRLVSNDLIDAKADLEKSVSFKAQNADTWLKLAEVNRRMGDFTAAIRNVQNAQQLEPTNKSLAIKEAQLMFTKKDYDSAVEKTSHILEENPLDEDANVIQAQSLAKQGKFGQALLVLNQYLDKNPENTRMQLEALKVKKAYEGTEAILPELVKLAEVHSEDPEVLTELTDWLIQTNRLDKAEKTAQTILRIIPEQASVHLMLGRLQRKTGQLDQAIAHLSDAIVHDPALVEAYIELGKTYQDRRNLEEAIKIFHQATEIDPNDPKPYYHSAMALKECKDYSGAEAMLKQAKSLAPDDPEIIRQLGVITAMNLINNLRETR
ncbi:MAG: tetratricopeptide repeat protein [Anaerolineaceae bacterium]|nr:tetratricopeptide repeat protein [Anaerolineaceae bacterium]